MSIEQERAAAAAEQRDLIRREIRNSGIPRPVLRDTGQAPVTDATPLPRTSSTADDWLVRYRSSSLLTPDQYGSVWDPPEWWVQIDEGNALAEYVAWCSFFTEGPETATVYNAAPPPETGPIYGTPQWDASGLFVRLESIDGVYASPGLNCAKPSAPCTIVLEYTLSAAEADTSIRFFGWGTYLSNHIVDNYCMLSLDAIALADTISLRFSQGADPIDPVSNATKLWAIPDSAAYATAGAHRVILSVDASSVLSVYHNGTQMGTGITGPTWYATAYTPPDGTYPMMLGSAGGYGYGQYKCGEFIVLDGYAATAADVATNPALATRYGLAARQNQWTPHLTGAATAVIV